MNRRPIGVILSAIVLGFASLFLILMALIVLLGTLLSAHHPNPAVPQASTGIVAVMGIVMAFVYLALAGWAIATIIGLVRLRSWARISIMVIGGGVAVIGFFGTLMCLAMPTLTAAMPMPPTAPPEALRGVFFGMAAMCLFVTGIGIWWLVYFALRKTRAAFLPSAPANFDPNAVYPQQPQDEYILNPTQQFAPAKRQANGNIRPVSITVLAVIFFVCGTMILPTLFLAQPLLLCSFIVHGKAAVTIKIALALWTVGAGIGLLKLEKPAWYLAISYCAFCVLNTLIVLLPGGLNRMHLYMQELMASNPMVPPMQLDPFSGPFFKLVIVPSVLIGVVIVAFAAVLLWRARWAFGLAPRSDQAAT